MHTEHLALTPLILYITTSTSELHGDTLHWLWRENSQPDQTGAGLEKISSLLDTSLPRQTPIPERSAILILPAEAALIASVTIPSDKPAHIRAAAPNLLEEWTAGELDELHIAYGTRASDGQLPLLAIERKLLGNWLSTLDKSSIRCRRIFFDALLLPYFQNTLTLLIDDGRALLRWGLHRGAAIETIALEPLLHALLRATQFREIRLFTFPSRNSDGGLSTAFWSKVQETYEIPIEFCELSGTTLQMLEGQLRPSTEAAIDLRQGDFALPADNAKSWNRWRVAVYTIAACAVLQLAQSLVSGAILQHRAKAIHTKAESLYRELFPNDKRLVDLQKQLHGQLGTLDGSTRKSFLELFGYLATEIHKDPGNPPIQLRSLTYDGGAGALQVEIAIANVQALDDLQKNLAAKPLSAKVLSAAVADDGSFIGRLSIGGN